MRAMILAAGRGERMMPLTQHLPKPLLPVADTTLIQRHLARLAAANIESVVINLHYLGDQIRDQLGDEQFGLPIVYSEESELLETAGGIRQALPHLGDAPFVVVNGDIYTNYDFGRLSAFQQIKAPHLVMVPNPDHHPDGDFGMDQGRLTLAAPRYTYAGIGVYAADFFEAVQPGRLMLRPLFDTAVAEGQLTGEIYQGEWTDVGTPERYEALCQQFEP